MFPACASTCVRPSGLQQHLPYSSSPHPGNSFSLFLGLQRVSQTCALQSCLCWLLRWPGPGVVTYLQLPPSLNEPPEIKSLQGTVSQQRTSHPFDPRTWDSSVSLSLSAPCLWNFPHSFSPHLSAFHRAQGCVQQCWGTAPGDWHQSAHWPTQPSPWWPRLSAGSSSSLVLLPRRFSVCANVFPASTR